MSRSSISTLLEIGIVSTRLGFTSFGGPTAHIGYFLYKQQQGDAPQGNWSIISKTVGIVCLSIFIALLILLPIASQVTSLDWIDMFDRFYRLGAIGGVLISII